jgi:hypothetical protein
MTEGGRRSKVSGNSKYDGSIEGSTKVSGGRGTHQLHAVCLNLHKTGSGTVKRVAE